MALDFPPRAPIYPSLKGNKKAGVSPRGAAAFRTCGIPLGFGTLVALHCGRFFFFFFFFLDFPSATAINKEVSRRVHEQRELHTREGHSDSSSLGTDEPLIVLANKEFCGPASPPVLERRQSMALIRVFQHPSATAVGI
eukprot:FR738580.1.p2 GENE.FR738580.1~~FR738580.1.p2  ORF type:complete len:139 (-),score=31.70 FR738580.1:612-1028(-)